MHFARGAALLLAALPFAAAAPTNATKDAATAPFVVYTQATNITEPGRNTSGVLVNVIHGNIKPFKDDFGASSTIDWKDEQSVGGGWNFGSGEFGGGSGGWKFNASTFEYGGGVSLNKNQTQANYVVSTGTDGSVKMTFFTSHDMNCTTAPASAGQLAKTECVVEAAVAGSIDKPTLQRRDDNDDDDPCFINPKDPLCDDYDGSVHTRR